MTLASLPETALFVGATISGALITAALALHALDTILDSRDRDAIRKRTEDFWIRTASLEFSEQLTLALRSRYNQMRQLQWFFLKLFILVALALSFASAVKGFMEPANSAKEFAESLIERNLRLRYSFYFQIDYERPPQNLLAPNPNKFCTPNEDFSDFREIINLGKLKRALGALLSSGERHPSVLKAYLATTLALIPLVLALPLALGLLISFNITLWLLARVTQSNLSTAIIVLSDLVLAVIMPTVLTGTMLTFGIFAIVFSTETLPDFAISPNPTWPSLVISSVSFYLGNQLATPLIVALFAKESWLSIQYIITTIGGWTIENIQNFFIDLGRIARLDTAINPVETLINYAVGFDVLFSLFYILPCCALVLMRRSQLSRRLFLRIVQWIAEHPRGPLIAVEHILTAFARYIGSLFRH